MTIIFYTRVLGKHYVGFRLPGWGVAVVAGAFVTLASVAFFNLGDFVASFAHRKDEQRLLDSEFARLAKEVQLVEQKNKATLDAATARLGELHARVRTLDTKSASLFAVATAYDSVDSSEQKGSENIAFTPGSPAGGLFASYSAGGQVAAGLSNAK